MRRKLDPINDSRLLNPWVRRSLDLFRATSYLDDIQEIYAFQISAPPQLDENTRRELIALHQSRRAPKLIEALSKIRKFPYEEPTWYLMKNVEGCMEKNPRQVKRIADSLFEMTAEEMIVRMEAAPKLNTQIGPMFNAWLRRNFDFLPLEKFASSQKGVYMLAASEEQGRRFLVRELGQNVEKRPDMVAKAGGQYVIGEAKWIGQPGGNQQKQVQEVIRFCENQRGKVRRIGIIDGFPWATRDNSGRLIASKEAVMVQESPYDILTAMLLKEYLSTCGQKS